jgi:hypothetical protein
VEVRDSWIDLAKFWRVEAIAMLTLHADESDDGRTYALAGWLAVPSAWDVFDPLWREMLHTITMPDGSPCPAFHTVDIVGRDMIKKSPFKGWTFDDEKVAFDKAITVIENKSAAALLWPVGVAVELPATFEWIPRDTIWLMLFVKLFELLARTYTAQRSIALMFDQKKAIENNALAIHAIAKEKYNAYFGEEYLRSKPAFDDDVNVPALQAADLLAYEWRKRITDETERPSKRVRESYKRIRAARPDGALWRYGRSLFDEAMKIDPITGDQSAAYFRWFMDRDPTHRD